VADPELVGIHEVASMAGVSRQAVVNWRSRLLDFPSPVAELRAGPVFSREQVQAWLWKRGIPMPVVISTINLKGGVGKTTTTVAVAEMLSGEFGKRVLLVDLDPQTNATSMLIGDKRWGKLNKDGRTLAKLFSDALLEPEERSFDVQATLVRKASRVSAVGSLSLLPSSLDMIDTQDQLGSMSSGRFFAESPTDILRRAVTPILGEFDIVLIDCPPNLGIITLNGLRMSQAYIIPTIPDILSTYGIPQIVGRVGKFSETIAQPIEPLGIVVAKYRTQSTVHRSQLRILQERGDAPLFETRIPEGNALADAASSQPVSTLRQKWGAEGFTAYRALTAEVLKRIHA